MTEFVKRVLVGVGIAFLIGLFFAVRTAGGQEPKQWALMASPEAMEVLASGLDTATVEKAFCLVAHRDVVLHEPAFTEQYVLHVEAAYVGLQLRTFADSVFYSCPPGVALAHWHLLDRGHVDYPSPKDYLSIVPDTTDADSRTRLAGLILMRESRVGEPLQFHYVIYAVDDRFLPVINILRTP